MLDQDLAELPYGKRGSGHICFASTWPWQAGIHHLAASTLADSMVGIITRKSRKGVVNRHAKTKVNCNKYLAFHDISRFLTLDAKW
jgi:hypothetical protein